MYPSLLRMLAIASFKVEWGMSVRGWRARTAFLMRVSMSAIGSVIAPSRFRPVMPAAAASPARLRHAGDQPLERQAPEADPAHLEAAQEPPSPPASLAAIAEADGVLLLLLHCRYPGLRRHRLVPCLLSPGGRASPGASGGSSPPRRSWRWSPRSRSCRGPCPPWNN